ncbi:MAG: hypothetical protein AAB453_01390 [Patescibacteria group bacterium]
MSEIKTVACLGSGKGRLGEPAYNAMMEVGGLLAKRGVTVFTGGFGGVGMEAPARGAGNAGGKSEGFTMWGMKGNPYLERCFDCRTEYSKHAFTEDGFPTLHYPEPEVEFGIRLGLLMEQDAFIVAWDTTSLGTMIELMTIIKLNIALWIPGGKPKRLAILTRQGGENFHVYNRIREGFLIVLKEEEIRNLLFVSYSPQKVVSWVLDGKQ